MKKEKSCKLTNLEDNLAYKFKNLSFLQEALTHPSFCTKDGKNEMITNQRLEFLGDSVLELIASEHLYQKFPTFTEGELTKIKSSIVNKFILAKWANSISLGEYIVLGKGEDLTGGRNKLSILSDCFEALLGAIYLDSGLKETKRFILPYIKNEIEIISKHNYIEDYKTLLQEISQKKMKCLPEYDLIQEKGPDHKKFFYVEVKLKGVSYGTGTGDNKKEAEQKAASNALKKLKIIN